jgi:hypothetical protein
MATTQRYNDLLPAMLKAAVELVWKEIAVKKWERTAAS